MCNWACRGVLADFGSVANYCSQNSKAPVLMVPPNVASLQTKQPGHLQAALCLCFTVFFFLVGVGKLFITSVKHTCSKRTTRAMFSLCVE